MVRVKQDNTFSGSDFAKTAHFKSSNTEAVITGRQPGTNGLSPSLPLFSSRVVRERKLRKSIQETIKIITFGLLSFIATDRNQHPSIRFGK